MAEESRLESQIEASLDGSAYILPAKPLVSRLELLMDELLASGGGGGTIIIDDTLSSTSSHAIANKAVYAALKEKADLESPDFTGIPKVPTADGTTAKQAVNVEYLNDVIATISVPSGSITIDDSLSETSVNAVQNKVITAAINDINATTSVLSGEVSSLSTDISGLTTTVSTMSGEINDLAVATSSISSALNSKADLESPDFTGTPTAPTADGTIDDQIVNVEYLNDVIATISIAGGVYDTALDADSVNAVQNKVITAAINDINATTSVLSGEVSSLSTDISGLTTTVSTMSGEINDLAVATASISSTVNNLVTTVSTISSDYTTKGYVKNEIDEAIANVSPETLETLEEIAETLKELEDVTSLYALDIDEKEDANDAYNNERLVSADQKFFVNKYPSTAANVPSTETDWYVMTMVTDFENMTQVAMSASTSEFMIRDCLGGSWSDWSSISGSGEIIINGDDKWINVTTAETGDVTISHTTHSIEGDQSEEELNNSVGHQMVTDVQCDAAGHVIKVDMAEVKISSDYPDKNYVTDTIDTALGNLSPEALETLEDIVEAISELEEITSLYALNIDEETDANAAYYNTRLVSADQKFFVKKYAEDAANTPDPSVAWYVMTMTTDIDSLVQLGLSDVYDKLAIRYCTEGSWTEWTEMASLYSPDFTGTPTAPTADGTIDDQIVNVEYLNDVIATISIAGGVYDTALDADSVNAVQNKVITAAINDINATTSVLSGEVSSLSTDISGLTTTVSTMSGEINDLAVATSSISSALNSKADLESPDFTGTPTAPTADGTIDDQIVNVEYLNDVIATISVPSASYDTTLDADSENAVQNKVVAKAINYLNEIVNGFETTIVNLVNTTSVLSGEVSGLSVTTASISSTVNDLVTTTSTMSGEVDSLSTDLSSLSTTVSGHTTSISSLNTDLTNLTTTVNGKLSSIAAGTNISVSTSGSTATVGHASVSRSDTTSTQSATASGTVTVIDSIASDSTGHITGANTKTVTLPAASGLSDEDEAKLEPLTEYTPFCLTSNTTGGSSSTYFYSQSVFSDGFSRVTLSINRNKYSSTSFSYTFPKSFESTPSLIYAGSTYSGINSFTSNVTVSATSVSIDNDAFSGAASGNEQYDVSSSFILAVEGYVS